MSGWLIRPVCRSKRPSNSSLGLSWTKAHLVVWRRFDHLQLIKHARDDLFLKKGWEVTSFSNFVETFFPVFSPSSHTISLNWVTTSPEGYFCGSYLSFSFILVGTRSGIGTTGSEKKEKPKMNTKNVAKKWDGLELESNKHGVRVRGMRPSNRTDGQAGGAIARSSVPPVNHSLAATRKAMIKKAALSITDLTGDISSSNACEER